MGKPQQRQRPRAKWLLGHRYSHQRAITFGAQSNQRLARRISGWIGGAAATVFFNSRSTRDVGM